MGTTPEDDLGLGLMLGLLLMYIGWGILAGARAYEQPHPDFNTAVSVTYLITVGAAVVLFACYAVFRHNANQILLFIANVFMTTIVGLQIAIVCILGFMFDQTSGTFLYVALLFGVAMATAGVTSVAIVLPHNPTPDEPWSDLQVQSFLRLSCDYAFSASIMLSVVSLLWGSNGIAGVVLAPLLLWTALQCSSLLMHCKHGELVSTQAKLLVLGMLLVMYAVSLVPFVYTAVLSTMDSGSAHNEATAPKFVLYIAISFACLFTSFVVPYICELFDVWFGNDKPVLTNVYCVLSLVAKVTLHAFILLTVVQQRQMLSSNTPVSQTDINSEVLGATAGTIVIGFLFGLGVTHYEVQSRYVHCICAFIHISTFIVGYVIAVYPSKIKHSLYTKRISTSFWSVETWLFKCYNASNSSYTNHTDCEDDARLFFLADDDALGVTYNYLSAASAYVIISSLVHAAAWHKTPVGYKYKALDMQF